MAFVHLLIMAFVFVLVIVIEADAEFRLKKSTSPRKPARRRGSIS
jgi:hypothetical protein